MGAVVIQSVPLPIPWTTKIAWAEHVGCSPWQTDMVDLVFKAMDAVYIELWSKKAMMRGGRNAEQS